MALTIDQMIDTYRITLSTDSNGQFDGRLRINAPQRMEADNARPAIVAAKAEIVAALQAQAAAHRRAAEERAAKIAAIPGLAEIRAARADLDAWQREFNASFDDVGGLGVRQKPSYDIPAMLAAYPTAAAYLEAESFAIASHDVKASAGRKALATIINGEDPAAAIEQMHSEWKEHISAHIWD